MLSLCRPCAKSGSANLSFYSTVAPSSERSNWSRSLQSSLAFDMGQSPNTDSTSAGLSTAPSTAYSNLDSPINFNPSEPSSEGRRDTPPRSVTPVTKASIGAAFQAIACVSMEGGGGRDRCGSMDTTSRKPGQVDVPGSVRSVIERGLQLRTYTILHPQVKQTAIWKVSTESTKMGNCR
jgi:hypothetical protein